MRWNRQDAKDAEKIKGESSKRILKSVLIREI